MRMPLWRGRWPGRSFARGRRPTPWEWFTAIVRMEKILMKLCSDMNSPAAESKRELKTPANGKPRSRGDAPSAIVPRAHLEIGANERKRLRAALHDGLGQLL